MQWGRGQVPHTTGSGQEVPAAAAPLRASTELYGSQRVHKRSMPPTCHGMHQQGGKTQGNLYALQQGRSRAEFWG